MEKLRWAEKEWRELDQELSEATFSGDEDEADPDEEAELVNLASN